MTKPWLETWTYEAMYRRVETPGGALVVGEELVADAYPQPDDGVRMRLAAAAPALVRALLSVEWGTPRWDLPDVAERSERCCPSCIGQGDSGGITAHAPGCIVDAALTAAGLRDQASRDAARNDLRAVTSGV